MRFFIVFPAVFLSILAVSGHNVRAARQVDDPVRLQSNIIALDRVQRNILHSLAPGETGQKISHRQKHELLVFVEYLKERNRIYCRQLQEQGGVTAVAGLPCPRTPVTLPAATAETADEEIADLDKQLNESLGKFDEMLLQEQEKIAAHQPRQRESGGAAAAAAGTGGYGNDRQGQGRTSGAGASDERTGEHRQSGRVSATTGPGEPGRSTNTGATTSAAREQQQSSGVHGPGGDRLQTDDDIVARQLREAAEKETDPELRKKLWQEYKKYKAGR